MFLLIALCLPAVIILGIILSPIWPLSTDSYYSKRLSIKKLWIFSLASFIVSGVVCAILYWSAYAKLMDREVWHFKIMSICHQEEWTTEESYTVTIDDGDTTDSEGHTHHHSHTETRYRTNHHGPYWTAQDERGIDHNINPHEYTSWAKIWSNEKQTGIHKGSSAGGDRSITGRIFGCKWTRDFDKIYPYSEINFYENKVRHCSSVFKGKEPTKELEAKYPRPAEIGNTSSVIGYSASLPTIDVQMIDRVNAHLGPKYLVHSILVILNKNADRSQVDDILTAWRNVNKNELVTFICLDGKTVKWCEVHSWMDNTTIHAAIRDVMIDGDFSAKKYADTLMLEIPKHWFKKNFHDFDYLKVEISPGWKIAAVSIILLAMVCLYFLIDNMIYKV